MRWSRIIVALALASAACAPDTGVADDVEQQEPELVAAGEELYRSNCAVCHGVDLTGSGTRPSLLSEVYEPDHHSDFAFAQAVEFGSPAHHWNFGPMPPIEGLSESDVEAIIAYVRENQRVSGFEPYPPG